MSIKVIVADDQQIIRLGIIRLLVDTDIEVVAEAATCEEAIAATKKHRPDVLLLDVRMPDMDGLDALELIHKEVLATKVIVMSAHDNETYVARTVVLGGVDYLLKDVAPESFVTAIQRAVRGEEPPADSLFGKLKTYLQTRPDPQADGVPLTRREYQTLKHLAHGLSNREIGYSMNISVETVKEHVQSLLRKLKMTDRTAAAVWLVRREMALRSAHPRHDSAARTLPCQTVETSGT
jgi:DNA-binding NarL/FixJ family response regulator